MPHINRIRVNNVKYNFGTQYYDDFIMRFSGKNTIYDLANGGGKSVLMLLLMQNLIPNCTLDEKQPIEKLFRSGNENTTIHSLIEWKLNPCHVKNGFQYMTTGFCARKAKSTLESSDMGKESASVDYFNYCIFYRQFNDNDLKNLPLSNGKERITYLGLRSYLQELEKRDFHVEVKIFDRKGDYQHFISQYGLFESEWEIIRGINKTEGHVRTYFETNYRTARKVVEDLLIEEIIEKSFYHKTGSSDDRETMANTLMDLKDQLVLLSKKKDEVHYYDKQILLLREFASRIGQLQGMYEKKQGLEDQLIRTYHTTLKRKEQKEHAHEQLILAEEKTQQHQQEITGQMDLAKICLKEQQMEKLQKELELLERTYEILAEECLAKQKELEERECDNYYLQYLKNEKEYLTAKETVDQILTGNDHLEQELYALAWELGQKIQREQGNLSEQILALQDQLNSLDQERDQQEQAMRALEIAQGVSQREKAQKDQQLAAVQDQIHQLITEKEIYFFTDLESQKENLLRDQQALLSRERKILEEIENVRTEIIQEQIRLQQCSRDEKHITGVLEQLTVSLGDFSEIQERMDQLVQIYGGTYESLENVLFQMQKELTAEHQKSRGEQKQLQAILQAYGDQIPIPMPKEVNGYLEEISRYYDENVISGYEYLKQKKEEERAVYLEQYPILPYAVVTSADLKVIQEDPKFSQKALGNQLIPIISKQYLEKEVPLFLEGTMIFAGSTCGKEEVKGQLEQLEHGFSKQYEKERVLKQDYDFVQKFLQMRGFYGETQKSYEDKKQEWKQIQKQREDLSRSVQQKEQHLEELKEAEKSAAAEKNAGISKIKVLEELDVLEKTEQQLYREQKELEIRRTELEEKILQTQDSWRSAKAQEKEIQRLLLGKQEQLRDLMQTKEQLKAYEKQGDYTETSRDIKTLEIQFQGKRSAYEQKNSDISDKKKLMASFENAMKLQKSQLQLLGRTLEQMQEKRTDQGCAETQIETLVVWKKELFGKEQEKRSMESQRKSLETQIHKIEGSIAHARQLLEETYGEVCPSWHPGTQLELFLEQKQEQKIQLAEEKKRQEAELRNLEQQCYALKAMGEDMERMMHSAQISPEKIRECLETGMSLKEQYEDLRCRYEKIVREEARKLEEAEQEKLLLEETLEKMGAYELAVEMKKNLQRPENEIQIREQIQALKKVVECLELEKDRISKDMESLQDLKDRFEAQCLQNCLNIKGELDRLGKLSKIHMDQQLISMVTLQIPYIKEELYADAMSAYIDQIIRQVENYESSGERWNYIRSQLSFKRLFSVIVTNMDAIRLTLYKRERMKEQSRYLRYEEAVGSTGQSQGIYIQFLVAIINYISSINSGNADPLELKKVIFIDNPFGAAKDVYIWEPIFALLKANNVQLIVPARGATPAITGHFEVNYILGQKLIQGRQQTVVVDYRSQTEEDQLEYTTMEFEQGSLFSESYFQ